MILLLRNWKSRRTVHGEDGYYNDDDDGRDHDLDNVLILDWIGLD